MYIVLANSNDKKATIEAKRQRIENKFKLQNIHELYYTLHNNKMQSANLLSGMIVGGFGCCCGTIKPRRDGLCCETEISPAERSEITPGPFV